MRTITCLLDADITNTWLSIDEAVAEMECEENQENRTILMTQYCHLDRLLRLMIDAKYDLKWEEFSFKRIHEETGWLCASDYWRFEDLWNFDMPDMFKRHEEKRIQEINKAKKLK